MARMKLDVGFVNFLTEQIILEEKRRLAFYIKNKNKFGYKIGAEAEARLEEAAKLKLEDVPLPVLLRKKTCTIPDLPASMKPKAVTDPTRDMRPVEAETLVLLYRGISHDQQGRYQYLRKRYRTYPEVKFRYPTVTSWDYGWKLDESIKQLKGPEHGRYNKIESTFYRRTGIF